MITPIKAGGVEQVIALKARLRKHILIFPDSHTDNVAGRREVDFTSDEVAHRKRVA